MAFDKPLTNVAATKKQKKRKQSSSQKKKSTASPKKKSVTSPKKKTKKKAKSKQNYNNKREKELAAGIKARKLAEEAIKASQNEPRPIRFLIACCAPKKFVDDARELLTTKKTKLNSLERSARAALELLDETYETHASFVEAYISRIIEAIEHIKNGKYDGRVNIGGGIEPDTCLLIIKHYAPDSCMDYVNEPWPGDRIDPANNCVGQYWNVLPRSLYKEFNESGEWTSEIRERVKKSVAIVDMMIIIPKTKTNGVTSSAAEKGVKAEYDTFAKDACIEQVRRDLIAFLLIALQIKAYSSLKKNTTNPMTVMIASKISYQTMFNSIGPITTQLVNILPRVPHGEAFAAKYLKSPLKYPTEVLKDISSTLKAAYSTVGVLNIPSASNVESKIAERFGGRIGLTEDEIQSMIEAARKQCIAGGTTSGKYATLGAAFNRVFDRHMSNTKREGEDAFSRRLCKEIVSRLGKEEKALYDELLERNERAVLLGKMRDKMQSLSDGGTTSGKYGTLGKAFKRVFDSLSEKDQGSLDAFSPGICKKIVSKLGEEEKALYNELLSRDESDKAVLLGKMRDNDQKMNK